MPDELLDIINDEDQVVGQATRVIIHQRGLQHRGVHVFLITPQGKLLVQQRSRLRETYPLALDCSVSEHVKAGEGYPEAADRGLAEELGIRQADIQLLIKFKMDYGPADKEICQLYEGFVDPTLVHFEPHEVETIDFYNLEELDALIREGKVAFSGWFVQLIRWYLGRPSELQVLKSHTQKRLLLPSD
jgi:isopentenyl-diphosphate delta-isomerase type 1